MKFLASIFLLLALVILCVRCREVSSSDCGLWSEFPHSGFCPDAPLY